jgi:hypothetical protein
LFRAPNKKRRIVPAGEKGIMESQTIASRSAATGLLVDM